MSITFRPSAPYLKQLLLALSRSDTPLEIRNECHRLGRMIELNDLAMIEELVERISVLADRYGIALPSPTERSLR